MGVLPSGMLVHPVICPSSFLMASGKSSSNISGTGFLKILIFQTLIFEDHAASARVITFLTVAAYHLPPRADLIPLRVNASAIPDRVVMPAL